MRKLLRVTVTRGRATVVRVVRGWSAACALLRKYAGGEWKVEVLA